jgi:hypothetical protein
VIDPEPDNPENIPELGTVFSDGTMIESIGEGYTGHGVWEPTGANTAVVTITFILEDGSRLTIRVDVEVAPDGQSFTSSYTLEFTDASGQASGEIGPGIAEATRLEVQAPGTPVASFEEFFAVPEGTPGATPAT